jgi:hypothetical protein
MHDEPRPSSRLHLALLALPALLATWITITTIATFAWRLTYPYDLEWMEGGVLAHAWRVQHMEGIYVEPSPEFIPMIYPPGYFGLLAALGWPFGLSHALGRAVSITGTLAACAALVWGAQRYAPRGEGEPTWLPTAWGLLASAIFLGFYERSGAFYDLVRPDGLQMGLLAWSIVLSPDEDRRRRTLGAVALTLAFVVKHNAGMYGFPLALTVWAAHGWREALRWGLTCAVPALLFVLGMQAATDGLFLTWLLDVPASHPMLHERFIPGTIREQASAAAVAWALIAAWALVRAPRIATRLPVPLVTVPPMIGAAGAAIHLSGLEVVKGIERATDVEAMLEYTALGALSVLTPILAWGAWRLRPGPEDRRRVVTIAAVSLGAAAWLTAGLMRAHFGGFLNVFITLHWVTAALAAAAAADLWAGAGGAPGWSGRVAAACALTLHLGLTQSRADLARLVPDEADVAAGDEVVAWLREQPGPVLSPFNPWLAAQSGKAPGWHLIAMWDIRHETGPFRDDVPKILHAIESAHYGAALDSEKGAQLGFRSAYAQVKRFEFGEAFSPKTGWRARPTVGWLPKSRTTAALEGEPTGDDAPEAPAE